MQSYHDEIGLVNYKEPIYLLFKTYLTKNIFITL